MSIFFISGCHASRHRDGRKRDNRERLTRFFKRLQFFAKHAAEEYSKIYDIEIDEELIRKADGEYAMLVNSARRSRDGVRKQFVNKQTFSLVKIHCAS